MRRLDGWALFAYARATVFAAVYGALVLIGPATRFTGAGFTTLRGWLPMPFWGAAWLTVAAMLVLGIARADMRRLVAVSGLSLASTFAAAAYESADRNPMATWTSALLWLLAVTTWIELCLRLAPPRGHRV